MIHVALIATLVLTATPAAADTAAAWAALRQGGNVALMRHASAPGGAGDPPGFKLEDCSTQRNVSKKGRVQAAAVGAQIKSNSVSATTIASSPWCRCLETAKLLDLGPVQVEPAFSNAFVLAARRDELKKSATAMINAWKDGTLIVVTHGANIQALSGHFLAPGEMIVLTPGSMPPRVIGRIPPPN